MLKDVFNFWSIFRIATYYFFFMLLFWGSSSKLGKKDFHKDFASLDVMKSLRGFAAIGVILHHISQETIFQNGKVLTPFVNAGAFFVAIFFFCSGYGLIKSLDSKENYLHGFVKNRILKGIMLPFYINILLYALYFAITKVKMPAQQWIFNFTGLTMMNAYAWFPVVLALLYLFFFLCFRFIKNRPVCFVIIGLLIIGLGLGFCYNGHFAWWSRKKDNWWMFNASNVHWWQNQKILWFNGEWWVNSAPAFLTGLIFANYESKIVPFFKRLYALKFHVVLLLTYIAFRLSEYGQSHFGYWREYEMKGPRVDLKIATYFCQVPLFALVGFLVILFMMKYHVENPVTRFFGKYSLDTYLMNLMALEITRYLMDKKKFPFIIKKSNKLLIFAITVFVLTIVLGVIEKKLTDLIKKLLFPKEKKPESKSENKPEAVTA